MILRVIFDKATKKFKGQTKGDLPSDFDASLHVALEGEALGGLVEFSGKMLNETENGIRDATAQEIADGLDSELESEIIGFVDSLGISSANRKAFKTILLMMWTREKEIEVAVPSFVPATKSELRQLAIDLYKGI